MQTQRTKTKRIRVFGIVQGVGYRYYVYDVANQLGLYGYVKNMPDGSVEVIVTGDDSQVEKLVSYLKRGTTYSRVDKIDIEDLDNEIEFDSFDIKF